MAAPPPEDSAPRTTSPPIPIRPSPNVMQRPKGDHEESSSTLRPEESTQGQQKKKRNHRGGKKKRMRRQSFAAPSDDGREIAESAQLQLNTPSVARGGFYGLHARRNNSTSSIESETLLDHREQQPMRPRRASTMGQQGAYGQSMFESPTSYRPTYSNPFVSQESVQSRGIRPRTGKSGNESIDEANDVIDERAPLMSSSRSKSMGAALNSALRRDSSRSSVASRKKTIFDKASSSYMQNDYNVNFPPSMPGSPELGASRGELSFVEMLRDDFASGRASPRANTGNMLDDYAVDSAEHEHASDDHRSLPSLPRRESGFEQRRHTIALQAEEDVCFPTEGMSELADDDMHQHDIGYRRSSGQRRRRGKWPDLALLDDWSRFEKEGRSEERRAKRITEPHLIGGRLRPIHKGWHRADDDAPYRFTYFNEEFQSTIHSQTISELVQPGGSFRELFLPDPPELTDSSSEDEEKDEQPIRPDPSYLRHATGLNGESRATTRQSSLLEHPRPNSKAESTFTAEQRDSAARVESKASSGDQTPLGHKSPEAKGPDVKSEKPKRYGERPTWWLDVLSPTDAEMKVLSKTFGIHPLTAEDIMMQEAREKVELFRNYYFVNYRSFEQDMNNEDFLEPVNMYVVVFREGVLSFHFSMTPHAANVRRRIRQLSDYLILSSDWISYAIIDDITDVFAPLIQAIEDEVDDIDDAILKLHAPGADEKESKAAKDNEKRSEVESVTDHGGDMLRRVGDCRKKVMGLYRLLGNKADVIKGFAKRCNEHWEVAPRSEIGLYLGDIQDHIVTMTGNLSHYEKILARSHGNYLAQINIRMNERQEQTADVLGKLTVLGTIVLPMNIITGLWGMNVFVPGQDAEGLVWFGCITAGLLFFGAACFWIAKILYRIV